MASAIPLSVAPSAPCGELELAARLSAGDPAALTALVQRFWTPLIRYAVRLVDDVDSAKDISQEVFVRVWETRTKLRSGSIRSYLYRVAHNLAVDELRKRDVRVRALTSGELASPPFAPDSPERTDQSDLSARLEQAVRALSPRRREVLVLAYFHSFSYQQIADQVGISVATVKNHLATALADLRRSLRPTTALAAEAD